MESIPRVDAEVSSGSLLWNGAEVPCFVIDYRQPGQRQLTARIWVRRSDGLVLQHLAVYGGMELVLEREPAR